MAKLGKNKRLLALCAIIAALLIILCLLFGKTIANALSKYTGIGYSKLPDIINGELEGRIEIHMIDVGQGDSFLIRSQNASILVDSGTNESEAYLEAYLDTLGVKQINYFICTHPHDDHIGGADMVLDRFEVKALMMTDMEASGFAFEKLLDRVEKKNINAYVPAVGSKYSIDGMTFEILGPVDHFDDGNNMSLVIKLTYGEMSFLFTGDMEKEAEMSLLENYSELKLDCDFYKVPHHGSSSSSHKEFLQVVTPKVAAISAELYNEYGHPHGEVLERLKNVGCDTILRTDRSGTVVVSSDGKNLTVIS